MLSLSVPAVAQDWSFDARRVGLGGAGSMDNVASKMIVDQDPYRAIVLPFGLFQILQDFDIYNPDSAKFDPVRALEYAASPLHFIVNRDTSSTAQGQAFVSGIRNGRVSRDLNTYRGFSPASDVTAEGLASTRWGGTITLSDDGAGLIHGVYLGAGPYASTRSTTHFDPRLTDLLASATPVSIPNAQLPITNGSQGQFAAAFSGGYRGRFPLNRFGSSSSGRDGLYVAALFNYLRGFVFADTNVTVRFDTDAAGLLTFVPTRPPPVITTVQHATSGHGFGVDVGVGAVLDRWEVGFGANGLGNRIDWTGVEQTVYLLPNLLTGSAFVEALTTPVGTVRVELPVDYRGNLTYRADRWTAVAEAGHGLGGSSFHGGLEQRVDRFAFRGGARYTLQKWNPSGGMGFDISRRVGLDVAAFGTTANIQRQRKLAVAASVRIMHGR